MGTKLFYQNHRLYTLVGNDFSCSILRASGSVLAERRTVPGSSQTLLTATNESGSALQAWTISDEFHSFSYAAYGETTAELPCVLAMMFNGAWYEPLTASYPLGNGYRFYKPALRRFRSPDVLSPFGAGGLNAYSYCESEPVNNIDVDGHAPTRVRPSVIVRPDRPSVIMQPLTGGEVKPQSSRTPPPQRASASSHAILRGARPQAKKPETGPRLPNDFFETNIRLNRQMIRWLEKQPDSPNRDQALLAARGNIQNYIHRLNKSLFGSLSQRQLIRIQQRAAELYMLTTSEVFELINDMMEAREGR